MDALRLYALVLTDDARAWLAAHAAALAHAAPAPGAAAFDAARRRVCAEQELQCARWTAGLALSHLLADASGFVVGASLRILHDLWPFLVLTLLLLFIVLAAIHAARQVGTIAMLPLAPLRWLLQPAQPAQPSSSPMTVGSTVS